MNPSFRDAELLSAYLDGQLAPSDAARLETRLRSDPGLRAVMDDLRAARGVLRKLPSRRAPRGFTLTRSMPGVRPPLPRAYPALRFGTALATLLLFFTVAVNALGSLSFGAAAPAAPAFGLEGGRGAVEQEAPSAAEEPAQPSAGLQAMPTLEAADSTRLAVVETPTPPATSKAAVPQEPSAPATPISFSWQVALFALALLLGGSAWLVRFMNERSWRGKAG